MGFSDDMRRECAEIWDKEHAHPFVAGIGDGSLELDKFRYYMRQDYVFLVEFCRAVSLAAAKAADVRNMAWFARLLHETLSTEMSLHVSFCADLGITREEMEATEASPTTLAYTRHLVRTGYAAPAGEIAAALLPCAWGYCEVGQMLHDRGAPADQPLYARWIEMYASPEFAELSDWLRSFVDRAVPAGGSAERRAMTDAFLVSSRYEYMFWDAAYRMEGWP